MGILDIAKEVQQESNIIKNHPVKGLGLEIKINYLKGLVLMMNVDDEIHQKEKEYLLILTNTFDISHNELDDIIESSSDLTKEEFKEIITIIKNSDIVDVFLIDSLVISYADAKIKESESSLFDIYCNMLGIEEERKKEIVVLAESRDFMNQVLNGDIYHNTSNLLKSIINSNSSYSNIDSNGTDILNFAYKVGMTFSELQEIIQSMIASGISFSFEEVKSYTHINSSDIYKVQEKLVELQRAESLNMLYRAMINRRSNEVVNSENNLLKYVCYLSKADFDYYKINGFNNNGFNIIRKSNYDSVRIVQNYNIKYTYPFFDKTYNTGYDLGYKWCKISKNEIILEDGRVIYIEGIK